MQAASGCEALKRLFRAMWPPCEKPPTAMRSEGMPLAASSCICCSAPSLPRLSHLDFLSRQMVTTQLGVNMQNSREVAQSQDMMKGQKADSPRYAMD